MAFKRKYLSFELKLGTGKFGPTQNNTTNLTTVPGASGETHSGLRASVMIAKPGGADMGRMEAAIYGLPLSLMNQLTTLGTQILTQGKNSITVKAWEEGQQPAIVFAGTISLAWADMRAAPAVCFRVSAAAGLYEAVQKIEPTSLKGSADVKQVMGQLAQKMGLRFEGNDVDAKVRDPYLSGSARDQAQQLAEMAGVQWIIDNNNLAIWKSGTARQAGAVLLSPQTGMVGYPAFNQAGVEITARFNPNIHYGYPIQVQSDLTPACGTWNIYNMTYELESEMPKGKWFMVISADRSGVAPSRS